MQNKTLKRILYILTVISYIGIIISYQYLPKMIPTHWNYAGVIDDYSNKKTIFFLGAIPFIIMLLLDVLPSFDPKKENYKKHEKAYAVTQVSVVILMIIMSWITIATSLGVKLEINIIIPVFIGILFILIGNYMPTIKMNYFFGIKNPWTLANEAVWKKTHKIGGYAFILSGFIFLITAFVRNEKVIIPLIILILIMFIGVNVYSYMQFRKINKKDI